MYDIFFEDYIEKYKNINHDDWIVLFDKNEKKNLENDVYTFCALLDKDAVFKDNYLNKPDWGFSIESFGKAVFGTFGWGNTEEMVFSDGTTDGNFEYLIALRYFDKYNESIEINPKFIWYYNLVRNNEEYIDPLTDDVIIKATSNHIEVKREYLKDFLCAIDKVCVIVFDHRRCFNSRKTIEEKYDNISGEKYFIARSVFNARSLGMTYDCASSIMGKVIISPFKKPHHRDYKYFSDDKEYEMFIIGYDEEEDEEIRFTCNEAELANSFGGNSKAPHFLTPVFFNIKVLEKYKNDSTNYVVSDDTIQFLSEWSIPFNINKERRVSVWLGDLGRIPYKEQQYWKSFNIKPEGKMDSNFVNRQILGKFIDSSRIESKLVPSLNHFNDLIKKQYGDIIFKELSNADKEIYNTFMLPINYSITEYQSFLIQLSKLTAESINVNLIKKVMGNDYTKEINGLGSVAQLGEFLKYLKIDTNERISSSIKKAYNSRNKLAGHLASTKEYNKIWNRDENYKFNSIEDARSLIEGIVSAIEYVIANYEVKKDETYRF